MSNPQVSAPKYTISLCLIVKNEAKNLPRCLASAKPYVEEIIVVDTGSTDETVEIAKQYDAKVSYFEWCDDFAAARNYAISQASGDWVLMLDADEELVVGLDNLWEGVNFSSNVSGYLLDYIEINDQSKMTSYQRVSLYRNDLGFYYVCRFHEELNTNTNSSIQVSYLEHLKILHYGFNLEKVQQKTINRNIPILERVRKEEGLNLRLLSCLAGMYAETQQLEKAQECSQEIFERLMPNLLEGNLPDEVAFLFDILFVSGVQALYQQDYEMTQLITQRGLQWCSNYPPLNYLAAEVLKALGFPLGAIPYFENCLQLGREGSYYKGEPFNISYMTTYPAYDLGCIYLSFQEYQEALAAFELALSFDINLTAAKEKIN